MKLQVYLGNSSLLNVSCFAVKCCIYVLSYSNWFIFLTAQSSIKSGCLMARLLQKLLKEDLSFVLIKVSIIVNLIFVGVFYS